MGAVTNPNEELVGGGRVTAVKVMGGCEGATRVDVVTCSAEHSNGTKACGKSEVNCWAIVVGP